MTNKVQDPFPFDGVPDSTAVTPPTADPAADRPPAAARSTEARPLADFDGWPELLVEAATRPSGRYIVGHPALRAIEFARAAPARPGWVRLIQLGSVYNSGSTGGFDSALGIEVPLRLVQWVAHHPRPAGPSK